MQPPDTEPSTWPSSRTASIAPGGRGELPHVFTTVASSTRRPASSQSAQRFRTSRSTLSMSDSCDGRAVRTRRASSSPVHPQPEDDIRNDDDDQQPLPARHALWRAGDRRRPAPRRPSRPPHRRSARRSRPRASAPRRPRAASRAARSCRRPAPSPHTTAPFRPRSPRGRAKPSPRPWQSPRRRPALRTTACSFAAESTSESRMRPANFADTGPTFAAIVMR